MSHFFSNFYIKFSVMSPRSKPRGIIRFTNSRWPKGKCNETNEIEIIAQLVQYEN